MPLVIRKVVIVFCSPAGSTNHVAQIIEKQARTLESPVTVIDLAEEPDIPFLMTQLKDAKDNVCLYIGSPVYAAHPVPPVLSFISHLPPAREGYAVPFVTWGGVSSGVALHDMGLALEQKGYRILGGAKILAEHSLMWRADTPLGSQHPDAQDDRMIQGLVEEVHARLKQPTPKTLPPSRLAYQPEARRIEMAQSTLDAAKGRLPKKEVIQGRCTGCGICMDECPVEAVSLSPYPVFGPTCISCYNCVRSCPEEAIAADFTPVFDRLRAMAGAWNETPPSEVFL
jgi:ferredoxin